MAVRGRFEFKFGKSASFCQPGGGTSDSKLSIIYAVQSGDPDLPIQLDLREEVLSAARLEARRRIADLQQMVGTDVPVRVAVGSVKVGRAARLRLKTETDPAMGFVGPGEVARGDGINKGKEARVRPAGFA
jgi:hypothetical protein